MLIRILSLLLALSLAGPFARGETPADERVKAGTEALDAGKLDEAKQAFAAALRADPKDPRAQHGMALVCLANREIGRACQLMDQVLAQTPKPDRAVVLNAIAAHMAAKNRARAGKLARDYLTANPKAIDEPMVNALGGALAGASPTERKNRLFTDSVAFYEIANKRLEAARPGYKRFGMEWHPAAEADAKLSTFAKNQKALDHLATAIDLAEQRVKDVEREIARQLFLIDRKDSAAPRRLAAARADLPKARAEMAAAQQNYDDFAASMLRPPFPKEVEAVAMSQLDPPPFSAVIAKPTTATATASTIPATTAVATPAVATTQPAAVSQPATTTPSATTTVTASQPVTRRSPKVLTAFAVHVDLVLTAAQGIEKDSETRVQLRDGRTFPARVVRIDAKSGLALLRVEGVRLSCLAVGEQFDGGPITCVGFPDDDLFQPKLRGMNGKASPVPAEPGEKGWTVSLNIHPRLAGAPLFAEGHVVGVCLAPPDALPSELPAIPLTKIRNILGVDIANAKPLRPGQDVAAAIVQVIVIPPR